MSSLELDQEDFELIRVGVIDAKRHCIHDSGSRRMGWACNKRDSPFSIMAVSLECLLAFTFGSARLHPRFIVAPGFPGLLRCFCSRVHTRIV